MCHIAVNDVPSYHKFLITTDGGMNVAPNFDMKLAILVNAVNTLRALGYEEPKVAVLANAEKVDPKIKESVEAGQLKEMYVNGEIKNCIVEGPVALDIALVKERAEVKHFESPVAVSYTHLDVYKRQRLYRRCAFHHAERYSVQGEKGCPKPAVRRSGSDDVGSRTGGTQDRS